MLQICSTLNIKTAIMFMHFNKKLQLEKKPDNVFLYLLSAMMIEN